MDIRSDEHVDKLIEWKTVFPENSFMFLPKYLKYFNVPNDWHL